MATNQDKVKELIELRAQAKLGGGEKRIESQHKKGKYTDAAFDLKMSETQSMKWKGERRNYHVWNCRIYW